MSEFTPIACPECGSTHWKRIVGGNYTAEQWIDTAVMHEVEEEDFEHSVMTDDGWACANDHPATDEVAEALIDLS
jgi:hypothetical protein